MINYKLYHFPLCPFSRKVRLFVNEKNILIDLANENFWERRNNFLAINPTGQVPLLLNYDTAFTVWGSLAICEYLEELNIGIRLLGDDAESRASIKKIINWFDEKFYKEVSYYILNERIIKYHRGKETPNPEFIRAAKININYHIKYMEHLLKSHKWLAGNKITMADFTAAAHLSVLDFFGDIYWQKTPQVKEWYSLIKSRPSFSDLLEDYIIGYNPSNHYTNLDF